MKRSSTGQSRSCLISKLHTACDCCRAKKIKCDGKTPCSRCDLRHLNCSYSLQHKSGPRPRSEAAPPRAPDKNGKAMLCLLAQRVESDGEDHEAFCNNCLTAAEAYGVVEENSADVGNLNSNESEDWGMPMARAEFVPVQEVFVSDPDTLKLAVAHFVRDTPETLPHDLAPPSAGFNEVCVDDLIKSTSEVDAHWQGMGLQDF